MSKPSKQPEMPSSVFAAIIGRPNVGKSSLTNCLVGEKVAIVSNKPQTTRNRITGIITKGPVQYVLLDTPGIHMPRTKLGARMSRTAKASIGDVDVAVMLFEPYGDLNEAEQGLLAEIKNNNCPAIAVLNKTDIAKKQADLDAREAELKALGCFDAVYRISVKNNEGCEELLQALKPYGSEGPHYFDDEAYTDMPEKALVAEIVREKMLYNLYDEVPHGIAVSVESFKERQDRNLIDIDINIYCERKSHKGMVIGKGGQMLKKIATQARIDCEDFLGTKVNLQCWVKVKEDWRESEHFLDDMGFKVP